jgi:hypothetical protein
VAFASFCLRAFISSNRTVTSRRTAAMPVIRPASSLRGTIVNSTEIFSRPYACSAPRGGRHAGNGSRPSHDLTISVPVTRAEALRNDEVKRLAGGFLGRVAEDTLRARVPNLNDTSAICRDDRIGRSRENCVRHDA